MKKSTIAIAATAAVCFFAVSASATAPAEFMKKVPISLSASAQTALGSKTATDIPVLVRLSTAISGFSYSDIAANGSDIAFGVDNGLTITVYPHEIDTWDPSGESLIWVKVPSVAAGTTFNLYYGNGVSTGVAASGTWSQYTGVWHFGEVSTLTSEQATTWPTAQAAYANSTAVGGLEGYLHTASISGEEGRFGKCFRTNTAGCKSGNYNDGGVWVNDSGANSPLDCGDTFTISGWFKHPTEKYYYDHIFYKRSASDNSAKSGTKKFTGAFAIELSASSAATPKFDVRGGSSASKTGGAINAYNAWSYLTFVFEGTRITVYENGVQEYSATGLANVTDNDAPLAIGTRPDIAYEGFAGDANWCGWIDEVRLCPSAQSADYVAIEYAAMADAEFLAFGNVETMDGSAPKFDMPPTLSGAGGSFTFTATLAGGEGDLYMVFTDLETGSALTNALAAGVSTPGVYQASPTLVSGKGYAYAVLGVSQSGTCILKNGDGPAYAGDITVVKTADASETTMTSGFFTVSRGSCTDGDLVVNYTVGGTAVAGETYEALSGSVVIPDGSTNAQIEVAPIYSSDVAEDVDVVVTLSNGAYFVGSPDSATVTVANSSVDPYVRYVATDGNDNNSGLTVAVPMATLDAAIASLDSVSADSDCTIYAAAGTYELELSASGATEWSVVIDRRISVIGSTGDPADVVFQRGSGAYGLFRLNNANAALKFVTIKDGRTWTDNNASNGIQKGAGVYLQNGVVEDCVVTGAIGQGYGHSGIGICMDAGRVSRCRITSGRSNNFDESGTGVYVGGGILEDSLIDSHVCGNSGAATVASSGTMVNCTVVGNSGGSHAGVRASSASSKIINCAIYGNVASQSASGCVYTEAYPQCYVNCASDVPIDGGVDCVSSTRAFADCANGDYRPVAGSPCIDAGTARAAYGTVSATDLAGNQRVVETVDIGCFENQKDAADVGFTWTADGNLVPSTLSVSADSFGIFEPEYTWTLHNSISGDDVFGSGKSTAFEDLTAGTYSITVSAGGVSWTSPDTYQIAPSVLYVDGGTSGAVYPYGTPETAAADIVTALNAASDGSTIYVAPGLYPISSQIVVDKGVSIIGAGHGYESTVVSNTVRSGTHRVFVMQHADALVANLTLTHGYASGGDNGGDAYFYAVGGTISNCLFTCGYVQGSYQQSGGAAYMAGGLVTHCEVTKCNAVPSSSDKSADRVFSLGGGGARVSNCFIHDCDATDLSLGSKNYVGKGPLIRMGEKTCFDNNTVVDCVAVADGAVVFTTVSQTAANCALVANCAIFDNFDANEALAVPCSGNIVWGRYWTSSVRYCAADSEIGEDLAKKTQSFEPGHYSAADCVITTPALAFVDYAGGDLRPAKDGPLFNAGSDDIVELSPVDFAGKRRVYKTVDIGCYEFNPPDGTTLIVR